MPEHLHEGVLRGVTSIFPITQHPERHPQQHPLVPLDQKLERGIVAGPAPADQRGIVRVL